MKRENGKTKKILIIEDEDSLQTALAEFLVLEKFEVFQAFDGEKGIEMAIKEKPDLILLDIVLPKKDGYEVLAEIKKNKETLGIPIIILTNLESPEDVDKAFSLGVRNYLIKSNYTLENIAVKIKEMLAKA
jgi:DNA-binding response OmpR family regulator